MFPLLDQLERRALPWVERQVNCSRPNLTVVARRSSL